MIIGERPGRRARASGQDEFLTAAELNADIGLYNAATSNAVSSGIHSKDAICLRRTGTSTKADNHGEALAELRRSGPEGRALESTLKRLLSLKTRAQYQVVDVAATDAQRAVRWARSMLDIATEVVRS